MTGIVGCEHLTLLHQIEHFTGIVILTCRRPQAQLDLNRLPNLKYVSTGSTYMGWRWLIVTLGVHRYVLDIDSPNIKLREKLWRKLIPKKAPVSSDVNHQQLAER